jgi:AI-2 transport protein TqsA
MTPATTARGMPRWLVVLLGLAATVITVDGLRAAADTIAPIVLALVLTATAHPVLGWCRRRGLPQWLAVVATLLVVYAVVIGLVLALAASLGRLTSVLPEYSEQWTELLDDVRAGLQHLGLDADETRQALDGVQLQSVVGFLGQLFGGLLGVLGGLLFVLATVAFMCVDATSLTRRLDSVPGISPGLGSSLAGCVRSTRSYLVVSTVFGLIVAVVDAGALLLLGVPLPWTWALLAFITNYIPNIGFVIGLVPPALLALLDGGPRQALLVVLVYCVVNFVIQSVIQPKFVGDAVGLSITATFLSLVAWAAVLGALGALLAIPLSLLAKAVFLDHDPDNRWALALVSGPAADSRAPSRRHHQEPSPVDGRSPAGQPDRDDAGGDPPIPTGTPVPAEVDPLPRPTAPVPRPPAPE